MATHCSILAWLENFMDSELGKLQSMELAKSQTQLNTHTHKHSKSYHRIIGMKGHLKVI